MSFTWGEQEMDNGQQDVIYAALLVAGFAALVFLVCAFLVIGRAIDNIDRVLADLSSVRSKLDNMEDAIQAIRKQASGPKFR
jgi:hypothetical protein